MKTYVNGRSVLHQGDGNQQTAAAPDVCKTPSPGGPVPVPYPNIAKDSDLAEGSTSVEVNGYPVALKGSYLSTSSGDEAGTAGGGLISSKTQGKIIFLTASLDVLVEGQGVVRFLDTFLANANTPNTVGTVYGDPQRVEGKAEELICQACGQPFSQHEPGLPATEDVQKEMRLLVRRHHGEFKQEVEEREGYGFMLGVLKCRTKNGKTITINSMSGAINSVPRNFPVGNGMDGAKLNQILKKQADRLANKRNNPIRMDRLKGKDSSSNEPGGCAAPKLLLYAMEQGWEPLEMVEQWFGPPKGDKEHGQNYEPCQTCRNLLPVLLCEARQRAKSEPIEPRTWPANEMEPS
ncbi:DUF4150 domain-containing protein [Cystobacter fuscus]|nr:DUF4150 domain-containing protein [Cystobacter fuscus]